VLDNYSVGGVYLADTVHTAPDYTELLERIKENNIPTHIIKKGDTINFNEASFDILWPEEGITESGELNERSVVILLKYLNGKIIFMGDLPAGNQENISWNTNRIDVLKVSHHGAKDAVSKEVLDILNPKFAVIPVGEENDFGHPAAETLQSLRGAVTLRTDQKGTIDFVYENNMLKLKN
jgi:competence protein ComEC